MTLVNRTACPGALRLPSLTVSAWHHADTYGHAIEALQEDAAAKVAALIAD